MNDIFITVFLFIIGSCFGSFFLVLGERGPKGEKVVLDRSKCDNCNHKLGFFDLIPILSYIFLLGKCRYCKKPISPLNIIVEASMGGLFAFSYLYYGFSYNMIAFIIVSSLMMIIFITDFLYYIILDSPLVFSLVAMFLLKFYYFDIKEALLSLLSGLCLFVFMFLVKKLGDIAFKRESLGGGDIKFSFIIGLILGFKLGLCCLILSCFLALPYSLTSLYLKKNNEVAYGPFLAASLFIVFVFADKFNILLGLF